MRRRLVRWREAAVTAAVLAAASAGWTPGVSAQATPGPESFNIVGLRMSRITLYKDCSMDKGVARRPARTRAVAGGSSGRIRTYNPPVNSRMLCR